MLNEKQANVLTEEELKSLISELIYDIKSDEGLERFKRVIDSHRSLNSRNAKLVHENDELMAENEKLRKLVSLANNLIPSENTTWTNNLKTILEELNNE